MKQRRKIGILLLIAFLLLISTVAGFLVSTAGLHLLITHAARWVPGLTISSISGSWHNLRLQGIQYHISGTDNQTAVILNVGQLHFSLQPSCLKYSQFCLNNIQLKDVYLMINNKSVTPTKSESKVLMQEWHTPWPVILKQLTVRNVTLKVNDMVISLAELDSAAQWQGRVLTLMPTKINAFSVTTSEIQPSVKTSQSIPHTARETFNTLFKKPLIPQLLNIHLPLDVQIKEISGQQFSFFTKDSPILIDNFLLQANAQDTEIRLDSLIVKSPQGSFSAKGWVAMADGWPVNMAIKSIISIGSLKNTGVTLDISGKLQNQLNLTLNLSGPVNAQLNAVTSPAKAGLPVSLTLLSKQFSWPLTDNAQYQFNNVKMDFSGKVTDYHVSIRSDLAGQNLPPVVITLNGHGNTEQFKLDLLRLAALQGHTDLSGVINWHNKISWNSVMTLTGINTDQQWPQWPARLNGKITTRGTLQDKNWQIAVTELTLKGHIKQQPLSAKGSIMGNAAGKWQIPEFNLILGRNTLNIKGNIDDTWSVNSSLDATDLDGIFPGLAGVAKGTLKLRGKLQAPELSVQLTANHLQWQQLFISHISLMGHMQSAQHIQGHLTLQLKQLKHDKLKIELLNLDARGNERRHQLNIKLAGNPLAGQLALEGSFNRQQQRFHGTLNNTHFHTPAGAWRPNHAIVLDYLNSAKKIIIQPHCWQNPKAKLCILKPMEAGPGGQVSLALSHFDLALINLAPEITMNGTFTGHADMRWQAGAGLPQARASLTSNRITITKKAQSPPQQLTFDTVNFNAELSNGKAQLDWLIKLINHGQFSGHVTLSSLQGPRNISGEITISDMSMAVFNSVLTYDEKISGILNADLRLGGNIQKPLVFGRMKLDKLELNENWMPVQITQGHMLLDFNGMKSTLYGSILTPSGQLTLSGDANWYTINEWHARIVAKGKQLRINIPPMILMDASPDLTAEASNHMLSLSGSIHIPWARIALHDLPKNVVAVSPDEIILNNNLQPIAPKTSTISINSNILIQMDNDVQLDAFGLRAKLQGKLKIIQRPQGLGLNGQIDIVPGTGNFRAYGQDLIVRKGLLLFSDLPTRPLLDIEAIRNPASTNDNVIAGVRVSGMADTPKTEIFSNPVLSQQETLSYLLRGKGLNNSKTEDSMMTSMLIGLGISKSNDFVGNIGENFGVHNLMLDTQGVGNNSRVVVSGNVTPDLQVKYDVGIFDSLAKLTLRYYLMPGLYLEGVSGVNQALDILYQFEFR